MSFSKFCTFLYIKKTSNQKMSNYFVTKILYLSIAKQCILWNLKLEFVFKSWLNHFYSEPLNNLLCQRQLRKIKLCLQIKGRRCTSHLCFSFEKLTHFDSGSFIAFSHCAFHIIFNLQKNSECQFKRQGAAV